MTYFADIRRLCDHGLNDRELSARLDAFEIDLFNRLPWALALSEREQNALLTLVWQLTRGGTTMDRISNAGTLVRLARMLEREARLLGADVEPETQKLIEKVMVAHEKAKQTHPETPTPEL